MVGPCNEQDIGMFRDTFEGDDAIFKTHRKGIAGTVCVCVSVCVCVCVCVCVIVLNPLNPKH